MSNQYILNAGEFVDLIFIRDGVTVVSDGIPVKYVHSNIVEYFISNPTCQNLQIGTIRIDREIATHGRLKCQLLPEGFCIMDSNTVLCHVHRRMTFHVVDQTSPSATLPSTLVRPFLAPYRDPRFNVAHLAHTIVEYYEQHNNNHSVFKAPYLSFVQSSGMGKTSTVLQLRRYFKVIYISCRSERIDIQPTRSVHVLGPLFEAITKYADKITIVLRIFFLSCIRIAQNVEGNFIWASREDMKLIMDDFLENLALLEGGFNVGAAGEDEGSYFENLEANLLVQINHLRRARQPVLIVFDEAKSLVEFELKAISAFRWIRRALVRITSMFAVFLDTISTISKFSPSILIDQSFRPTTQAVELFPVYITTSYMDTLVNQKDTHMNIRALSSAILRDSSDGSNAYAALLWTCLLLLLLQGRPLWAASSITTIEFKDLIKFALTKVICGLEVTTLHQLKENRNYSALLSIVNYKFNLIVAPGHSLAHEIVARNLAVCIGVSHNRNEIFTACASEPVVIEAINFLLLYSNQEDRVDHRRMDRGKYFGNLNILLEETIRLKEAGVLSRGDSGEFIARVLLTIAADMTRLINGWMHSTVPLKTRTFLTQLLGLKCLKALKLPPEYLDGYTSCSHFVRLLKIGASLTSQLAKDAFRRGAALITDRNFVGSDLEIPIAYCRDRNRLNEWKALLLRRGSAREQLHEVEKMELDRLINDLTVFTFISISVKNQINFTYTNQLDAFITLDPLIEGSKRSKYFKATDGFNLQLLFSLPSEFKNGESCDSIKEFVYSSNTILGENRATLNTINSKRVVINGFTDLTFSHWVSRDQVVSGFNKEHILQCFDLLHAFDFDLESKKFLESVEQNAGMVPLSFDGEEVN